MRQQIARKLTRLGITALIAGSGVAAGAGVAGATDPSSYTINGDLQPFAGVSVLHIDTHGQTAANGAASGDYNAYGELGNITLPVSVAGPVTCITFNGPTVSLIYPIASMQPALFAPNSMAVQITATKGMNGQPNYVGVMGPMPTNMFHGCAPGPTPFMFNGTVDIK